MIVFWLYRLLLLLATMEELDLLPPFVGLTMIDLDLLLQKRCITQTSFSHLFPYLLAMRSTESIPAA